MKNTGICSLRTTGICFTGMSVNAAKARFKHYLETFQIVATNSVAYSGFCKGMKEISVICVRCWVINVPIEKPKPVTAFVMTRNLSKRTCIVDTVFVQMPIFGSQSLTQSICCSIGVVLYTKYTNMSHVWFFIN